MISFFEVVKRALNGPYYAEQDFAMKVVVPKLREVVAKYDIRYDPENPVPDDDKLADDVFQAGLELCAEAGCYCTSTSRVISFSKEEILEGLRDAPAAPVFGEGADEKTMRARQPESEDPPYCFLGAGGGIATTEDVYVRIVEGYGRNPLINSVTCPTITLINGMTVQAGSPLELLACIRSVVLGREALRRAQRPGLPIMNSIATAVTDAGKITGSAFGLRNTDAWVIGFMAPLQVNFERLNEVAYVRARGGQIVGESGPIMGGYAGGPAGVAVINVAYHLLSILVMRAAAHLTFPMDFRYGSNTSLEIMWPISISTQAICRNSHLPMMNLTYVGAGPMTEMCLYEIATCLVNRVASGGGIEFGGVAKAINLDHFTPMEPRFASEVAYAVAGMTRAEANEIVKKLLPKYVDDLPNPPKGKRFQEAFDWGSIEPCQEYVDLYGKVKEELTGYGLRFK
jgi:methylamine--corrinoid protein Co-methyltransferase